MTTKKNTKRALLTSVMATVLCAAMLIGTTFAWFTDSVASGKKQDRRWESGYRSGIQHRWRKLERG